MPKSTTRKPFVQLKKNNGNHLKRLKEITNFLFHELMEDGTIVPSLSMVRFCNDTRNNLLKLILFDQNKQVLGTYEKKFESNLATNLTLSLGPKISASKLMKTLATKFFNKQTDPDVKLLFVSAIRSCGNSEITQKDFCCYFLQFFFQDTNWRNVNVMVFKLERIVGRMRPMQNFIFRPKNKTKLQDTIKDSNKMKVINN